jgi:predicted NBD/HSP70 family sugar kinase
VPINVVNDGDVSALAGAITLEDSEILGIAMGTSEAVGYVNKEGNITGWLNELAFCPVDVGADKAIDQWPNQLDWGLGSQYFSQDAVIRLAPKAGIELDPELTLAKKLKAVQELIESGDERPVAIFKTIGVYFAHALAYYSKFYEIKHILLLGRVSSGKGGDILIETAKKVLAEEFPEVNAKLSIDLPDEKFRRLGQSVVAASL